MAKTNFGPRTIVSSEFLNGAQQIYFDGADEDWHYPPINKNDIDGSFNDVFVTLEDPQTILAAKVFHNDLNVAPPSPPPGEEDKYRFTTPVVGADPNHPTHLTTKSYVDQEISSINPPPIINLGGGIEVFKEFSGSYVLRTLYGGDKIGLTQNTDDIQIEFSADITDASSNGESLLSSTSPDILFKTIIPGNRINSSSDASEITLDVDDIVASDFVEGDNISIQDSNGQVEINSTFEINPAQSGIGSLVTSNNGLIKNLIAGNGIDMSYGSDSITVSSSVDLDITSSDFVEGDNISIEDSNGQVEISSTFSTTNSDSTGDGKLVKSSSGEIRNVEGDEGVLITEKIDSLEISLDSLRLSQFHRTTNTFMTSSEFEDLFSKNNFVFLDNTISYSPFNASFSPRGQENPYIDNTSSSIPVSGEKITISDASGSTSIEINGGIHRLKNLVLDSGEIEKLIIKNATIYLEEFLFLSGIELDLENAQIIATSAAMLFAEDLFLRNSSIKGNNLSLIIGSINPQSNVNNSQMDKGIIYVGVNEIICNNLATIRLTTTRPEDAALTLYALDATIIGDIVLANSKLLIKNELKHYFSHDTSDDTAKIFEAYNSNISAGKMELTYYHLPPTIGIVHWVDCSVKIKDKISYNDNYTTEINLPTFSEPLEAGAFRIVNCSIGQNDYVLYSENIDRSLDADAFDGISTNWYINSVNPTLDIYDSYVRVDTLELICKRNLDNHFRPNSFHSYRTTLMVKNAIFEYEDTGGDNNEVPQMATINDCTFDAQSLILKPINITLFRVLSIGESKIDLNLSNSINGYQANNHLIRLVECTGRIDMPEIDLQCPFLRMSDCAGMTIGVKWNSGDFPLIDLGRQGNNVILDLQEVTKLGMTNIIEGTQLAASNNIFLIFNDLSDDPFSPKPTRLGVFDGPVQIEQFGGINMGFSVGQFYNHASLQDFTNGLEFEYYDYSSSSFTTVTNPGLKTKHGDVFVL